MSTLPKTGWISSQFDYRPETSASTPIRVTGFAHASGLGVCRLADGWHIVHVPSGFTLGSSVRAVKNKTRAMRAVEALHEITGLDYTRPREEFGAVTANATYAALREIDMLK